MSHVVCWLLLAVTVGSLVPASSTVIRRSLTCEEELQAVNIDAAVCEKIRSAVSSVRHAVIDIDVKISKSTTEAIKEATEIMRKGTKLLKEQVPMYLRKKRSLETKQKREVQGDLADFHEIAKKSASSAVQAVKDASKEIRDALFNAMIALHPSQDNIDEAARHILNKVISKRSADDAAIRDAISKISDQMKDAMKKAALTGIDGFKDMMDNMEMKMIALLKEKVPSVAFFDPNKAQIAELADRAAKDLVDYYDNLAVKSVSDAIHKVNKLTTAVYDIGKSNPNLNALFTLRDVVEKESQAVKDAIHTEEANPEESVAVAMQNAADQMVKDYNDLVQIVSKA